MSKHAFKQKIPTMRTENVQAYIEVEQKLAKKSVWATVTKPVTFIARKIAAAAKLVARKVAAAAKTVVRVATPVAKTIAKPFVAFANIPAVRTVGRFVAKNGGWILSGIILTPWLIIAPVPTLIGTAMLVSAWQMMNHESWFVRAMGRTLLDIGTQVIANGVVDAARGRKR
jgi:hypothetical protein